MGGKFFTVGMCVLRFKVYVGKRTVIRYRDVDSMTDFTLGPPHPPSRHYQ